MCVNYAPTRKERIDALVQVFTADLPDWPAEVWQDYAAPIIRAGNEGAPELLVGTYGILPKAHMPPDMKRFATMNARAETIGEKRAYLKA